MSIDAQGVVSWAQQRRSPNCDERPAGERVTLLVIHSISLPPGQFGGDAVERLFTNSLDCTLHPYFEGLRGLRVSAHFLIRRGGDVTQFVPGSMRAWHAGESNWKGRSRCNDFSLGIELEGGEDMPFAAAQYRALVKLTKLLMSLYPIEDVVGHSDVAPGRKTDPGARFDWLLFRSLLSG